MCVRLYEEKTFQTFHHRRKRRNEINRYSMNSHEDKFNSLHTRRADHSRKNIIITNINIINKIFLLENCQLKIGMLLIKDSISGKREILRIHTILWYLRNNLQCKADLTSLLLCAQLIIHECLISGIYSAFFQYRRHSDVTVSVKHR